MIEATGKLMHFSRITFDILLMAFLYIGGAITLNVNWTYLVIIIFASLSGAAVLSYFKREREVKEIVYRAGCAALCGLVVGAAITRYLDTQFAEYVLATYFLSSLLSLFFIGSLLAITEKNATNVLLGILQRLLNTAQPKQIGLEIEKHDEKEQKL